MSKTLRDLWRGNICEMEHSGNASEIGCAEHLAFSEHEQLADSLNEEQKAMLESYTDHMYSVSSDYAEEAFVRGVRLGMRLAFEAMS